MLLRRRRSLTPMLLHPSWTDENHISSDHHDAKGDHAQANAIPACTTTASVIANGRVNRGQTQSTIEDFPKECDMGHRAE